MQALGEGALRKTLEHWVGAEEWALALQHLKLALNGKKKKPFKNII